MQMLYSPHPPPPPFLLVRISLSLTLCDERKPERSAEWDDRRDEIYCQLNHGNAKALKVVTKPNQPHYNFKDHGIP